MNISAHVVKDSTWNGSRIITMQLRYPRIVHTHLLTHRAFSRNSASSRAIPIDNYIESVMEDMAHPVHWGKNQKGMQAKDEEIVGGLEIWTEARDAAVDFAKRLQALGAHKQVANRLLEPFVHIDVVVTATEWDNFFEQRLSEATDPTMQTVAHYMANAVAGSRPVERSAHLPYVESDEISEAAIRASVVRCCRVSYARQGVAMPDEDELRLFNFLRTNRHFSPFEHVAVAAPGRWANFDGWRSYRHLSELDRPC